MKAPTLHSRMIELEARISVLTAELIDTRELAELQAKRIDQLVERQRKTTAIARRQNADTALIPKGVLS